MNVPLSNMRCVCCRWCRVRWNWTHSFRVFYCAVLAIKPGGGGTTVKVCLHYLATYNWCGSECRKQQFRVPFQPAIQNRPRMHSISMPFLDNSNKNLWQFILPPVEGAVKFSEFFHNVHFYRYCYSYCPSVIERMCAIRYLLNRYPLSLYLCLFPWKKFILLFAFCFQFGYSLIWSGRLPWFSIYI